MVETSFAGSSRVSIRGLHTWKHEGEFITVGQDVFDGDRLVDLVYEIYLPLIASTFLGGPRSEQETTSVDDIGMLYMHGLYVPCVERVVLGGQVDLLNDTTPPFAGVVLPKLDANKFSAATARKVDKLPRGRAKPCPGVAYAVSMISDSESEFTPKRLRQGGNSLSFGTDFVVLKEDGSLVPSVWVGQEGMARRAKALSIYCRLGAIAINAWQDASAHVWRVVTQESLFGDRVATPLTLGCSAEHIKSLFYARAAPLTEAGRKRPILHWVRAHQRRMERGIDIDITRHLRGIERFEMDGFGFEITSPRKGKN